MDFSPFPRPALTHSSTLRRLLYEALAELGLDPTDTYRRVFGLAPSVPWLDGREDHDSAPRFWLAMAGMTGDDDIGLHLGEVMRPRPMDVMGYLLQAARDLRQGLEAFVRYQHVASGGFAARLEEHGEVARLVIDLHYVGVGHLRQQVECVALLLSRMLGAVLGSRCRCWVCASATPHRGAWLNTVGCSGWSRCSPSPTMRCCCPGRCWPAPGQRQPEGVRGAGAGGRAATGGAGGEPAAGAGALLAGPAPGAW